MNITTLKGNRVSISEAYINGNGDTVVVATVSDKGAAKFVQVEPGKFRSMHDKGGFLCDPAILPALAEMIADGKRQWALESAARETAFRQRTWDERMTREQYETECARLGIAPQSDDEVQWNNLSFMTEDMLAHHRRYHAVVMERGASGVNAPAPTVAAPAEPASPSRPTAARARLSVQLWELCERCGVEPSYHTPRGHFCAQHA